MKAIVGRNALFVGLFCLVCGGTLFWVSCGRNTWNWYRARHWLPAMATVIRSGTRDFSGDPGAFIEVEYAFEVDGQSCTGSTHDFSNFAKNPCRANQMIAEPLAPGRRIQIFYDPKRPTDSVVDRSFDYRWLMGLAGLAWAALGVGFMIEDHRTIRFVNSPPLNPDP